MSQTETAIMIVSSIVGLFGGPFFILMVDTIATDNQSAMGPLVILGFSIAFFCLLVLIIGVWLDGFNS